MRRVNDHGLALVELIQHDCPMGVLQFVAAVISSLVWPAVLVTFVLVFRKRIADGLKGGIKDLLDRLSQLSARFGGLTLDARFEAGLKSEMATQRLAAASMPPFLRETADGGTVGGIRRIAWEAFSRGPGLVGERRDGGTPIVPYRQGSVHDAEPGSDPRSPFVQLDSEVRSLLTGARSIVHSQPREAVVSAGRALELSIASTLDSLGIPHGVDAAGPNTYVPAIFELRQAGVVDGIQADSLDRLSGLYRSAIQQSTEELSASSALQYIMFIENEVGKLAVQREACIKLQTSLSDKGDDDDHDES
jgi:hypothetical protein